MWRVWLCVLLVAALAVVASGYEGCTVRYGRRGCRHRMLNGVLVTCDGMGSEPTVPQNVPSDVVYLSLTNFALTQLTKDDFNMFKKVECLSITDSGVDEIDPDAFSGMDSLLEVSLQNTNIHSESLRFVNHHNFTAILLTISGSPHLHHITIQPTKNLLNLKTLNLNGNGIREFRRDIFAELKNLERLDLSDNNIKNLDWSWLNEMTKLNQLYLHGNQLQTIPQSMYGVFFAVKELTLSGNRLHCNCKLRWLKEFYELSADKTLDVDEVACVSPRKDHITNLEQSDFTCSKPSTPVVKYVQMDDHRYEINCSSVGDPAPKLHLTLPDGRSVVTPPSADLAEAAPITPQIVTSPGQVHCEAANSEGWSETTEGLPESLAMSHASSHLQISTVITITTVTSALIAWQQLLQRS